MSKDIDLASGVNFPDVASTTDVAPAYECSNEAFDTTLNKLLGFDPEGSVLLNHPLFGNMDTMEERIEKYKKNINSLGCLVTFGCQPGLEFDDQAKWGVFASQQPNPRVCPANGTYELRDSLKNWYPLLGPLNFQRGVGFKDIFANSKKGRAALPNLTFKFQDKTFVDLDTVYIAHFYITLEFSCKDEKIEVSVPAFLDTDRKPCDETVFFVTKAKDNERLRITYVYEIPDTTILQRKLIPKDRLPDPRVERYEFVPADGQRTPADILKNEEYTHVSPVDASEFEPSIFDNDPDTPQKGLPDNCKPDFGSMDPDPGDYKTTQDKINKMLRRYLSDRITQLQDTIEKELATYAAQGLTFNGVNQAENCSKALDILKSCDSKIKIVAFQSPEETPGNIRPYRGLSPWYDVMSEDLNIKGYVTANKLTKINISNKYEIDIRSLFHP